MADSCWSDSIGSAVIIDHLAIEGLMRLDNCCRSRDGEDGGKAVVLLHFVLISLHVALPVGADLAFAAQGVGSGCGQCFGPRWGARCGLLEEQTQLHEMSTISGAYI